MLSLLFVAGSVKADQPNILFILADDLTWEGIGAVNSEVKTPNLDRLMDNSVSFRRAYNMGSYTPAVCVASRTMFNSGLSLWHCPQKFGRKSEKNSDTESIMAHTKAESVKTWSQLLSDAGYTTYFSGKWHVKMFEPKAIFDVVGTERPGMPNQTPEGYDRPQDENDKRWLPWDKSKEGFWKGGTHWSEVLRNETIGFIEQASGDPNPFFMYIAFNAPHDPRQAPKEYVDMYPLESIKVPENFIPQYPYAEAMESGPKLRDERLAPFPRTEYSIQVNRAEYYALITHMDEQIGQIMSALEKSGQLDNTYIFFTADHGLAVGHHGLLGKQNMYEDSIGAPLMVSGPGLEKGKLLDQRVYIQDIVPSTLELANASIPETVEFESFMPLVMGERSEGRDVIYGAYTKAQRCLIQADWKLIYYPKATKFRLFNLVKDPHEMNDLADHPEYQERLDSMKSSLADEMKRLNDPLSHEGILSSR